MHSDDEYWSIDAVGLSEESAEALAGFARTLPDVLGAETMDPHVWLTWNLDRGTVELDVHASRASLAAGLSDPEDIWTLQELVADLQQWLDTTRSQAQKRPGLL